MKGKKLVALFLMALLCLSVACAFGEASGEKVSIRVLVKHDIGTDQLSFADMKLFNEIAEESNMDIQWEEIPSSAMAEKVGLILTGGDLPDAF